MLDRSPDQIWVIRKPHSDESETIIKQNLEEGEKTEKRDSVFSTRSSKTCGRKQGRERLGHVCGGALERRVIALAPEGPWVSLPVRSLFTDCHVILAPASYNKQPLLVET